MQFGIKKTRLVKALFLTLVLCSILVGCARSPSRGWSGPTVSEGILYVGSIKGNVLALEDIYTDNPKEKATFTLESQATPLTCAPQISKAMSIYGTPAVANGLVYVGDYNGNVYAFDATVSGETSWKYKFETGGAIVGSPVVAGDTVYIGSTDGKLYALPLDLREPKWTFPTKDKIWSTPVVEGNVVYIGSSDHNLYAIDAESGKGIWKLETEGAIASTPLVDNGTVYIGSFDSKFYAVDVATEEEKLAAAAREEGAPIPIRPAKWVFEEAGNWFWTQALAYNGEIWVGCLDHKVYAVNAENPDVFWVYDEPQGAIHTPPVLVKELIVIGSQDGNVYIIDPINKKRVGEPITLGAPILAPLCSDTEKGVVYVHAQDGNHILYAIEVTTGRTLWEFKTSG